MRYANMGLGALMLLFAAVQLNDPDGPLWIVIYLVPAAWAFAAAFRLPLVRAANGMRLLWLSLAAGLVTTLYYWPSAPEFWRKDVWWIDEAAREGMGLMVGVAVLVFVLYTALRKPAA